MPSTYSQIASTQLASAQNSVTISGIPSSYTDLRVIIYIPSFSGSNQDTFGRFNGDTGTNYSDIVLQSNGSVVNTIDAGPSLTYTNINLQTIYTTTSYPTLWIWDIFEYASSQNKGYLIQGSGNRDSSGSVTRVSGTWRNSAAISSIEVYVGGSQTMSAGTQISVYGILAAA